MSDLSTNGRSILNNIDCQNHTNSRPKLQPVRVKELLHLCESDDDESEDKPQDSDIESDSDDPQSLSQDDCIEDVFNKSSSMHNITYDNEIKTACEISHTIVSSEAEKSVSVNNITECTSENKSVFHEHDYNEKSEKNIECEQSNQMQLSIEIHTEEKIAQTEHKNKHVTNMDIKKSLNQEQPHKSELQSFDQQCSSKINNNSDSNAFVFQHSGYVLQSGVHNIQNANINRGTLALKSIPNEEETHHESVSSAYKALTSDIGLSVNSTDQWVLQTPLKHAPVNSTHPDPCFSRRNIIHTPQNKLSDIPNNHGLTPATTSSHWFQNSVKQTPLQNRSNNLKNSVQTPDNTVYFTLSNGKHETPKYLNTNGMVRRPLVDTAGFTQKDASGKRLLQGFQLSKVNEITPTAQAKLTSKNLDNKISLSRQVFQTSENVVHLESDVNEELKENRYSNIDNALVNKEINKASNSKYVSHYPKDSKEILKAVCNHSQKQHSEANNKNQQQELKETVDNASNVQFSMPYNISKSRQSKTIFVKGKEYLVLGTLGHGMSGEVLRVQNLSSLELCAIKCVNLKSMDKESAQGCLEEISMLHKLQAPCVVKMFDYEIKYPMVYVVMEMGDTDLSRLLKTMSQEKQIPLTMILYYWTEMLTAVKHIHDNGVIHSDLKPANFLLVRGRLKLIDFGIASSMNADMTSVIKNCPIGTLNYISPEALMDIGENSDSSSENVKYKINFKSDVWSLGCILYSLVYGHTPFHHIRSQWAKVNAITNPKLNIPFPKTLSSEGNKIIPSPPILIDVMRKCLQHDPKARPTVTELLQIEYIPTKEEHVLTTLPEIPANILVKMKHTLSEDEWRQLTWILENRRYT
ncbi:PREDICTED: serine/threonine-protein kinase MPS1 [Habropoda laboriosa]|uniref:serine/threonine-protein kinase MPS1 n=1 Tax=Habropoda laboriosa TaxID=597456 RepID=UPI00083E388A|nr:PREDICTED: serine/threonine-protein kinase MPS1 [Habropoda laboriosa]